MRNRSPTLNLVLRLARRKGGVTAPQLSEHLTQKNGAPVHPWNSLHVLRACESAGYLTSEPGPMPHRRSPGRRPVVFRVKQ